MLKNKAGVWKSVDSWNFRPYGSYIYIENTSKENKVWTLGVSTSLKVTLELDTLNGNAKQLWKKGDTDAEGFHTLENSAVPKVITAISESGLEIKGNITLRLITS